MRIFKCFITTLQIVFFTSLYAQEPDTFSNPLLDSGADPWVIYKDGFYYYTHTQGNRVTLWKTRSVTNLREAESKDVWKPPQQGPNSKAIWALP
jgi:GH43 family beta-xylosidase